MAEEKYTGAEEKAADMKQTKKKTKKDQEREPEHIRDYYYMEDEDILAQVLKDVDTWEKFAGPFLDKFREWYKLYKNYIEEENIRENGANLFIPYTFHAVETIVPKIVLALFGERPYAHVMPVKSDDEEAYDRAKKMNSVMDYYLDTKIHVVPIFAKVIRTMVMMGTAFTKQSWEFEQKEVRRRERKKVMGISLPNIYTVKTKKLVTKDHPQITQVSLFNQMFDPAATNEHDARFMGDRYWEDIHELRRMQKKGIYKNIDKLEKRYKDAEDQGNAYIGDSPSDDLLSEIGMSGESKDRKKGVEIIEMWTPNCVVKIANRCEVIFVEKNLYFHAEMPYTRHVFREVEGEFYGGGAIEPIESLQLELNTTRNQRIDNVSLIINNMWKVRNGSSIDESELVSRPNGIINVDEMDDIEELKIADVTASAYNEETIIKHDIDNTLGIYDSVKGSSPARRETATTSTLLANAGSERFKLDVLISATVGVDHCFNQILALIQQFMDEDIVTNLLNGDQSTASAYVTPDDILGEFEIIAINSITDPIINKEIRQNQMVQLFGMLQNSPAVKQDEFIRRVFEAFDLKNIDALLNKPETAPAPVPGGQNGTGQGGGLADIINSRMNVVPLEETQDGR
jgi:hypothetical protein